MTTGIIDAVRVNFTQSGGAFQLGTATDASVRNAVGIADATTVYYIAVGLDANGAEVERDVGEGVISSSGTVITPSSRSFSTSGAGGHTFTAPTKHLMLGVTRAMLDAIVEAHNALASGAHGMSAYGKSLIAVADAAAGRAALEVPVGRGPGDGWTHVDIGFCSATGVTAPTPYQAAAIAGGAFGYIDPVAFKASAGWEARCHASNASSGYSIYLGVLEVAKLRPSLMRRTRIVAKTISADQRRVSGWVNSGLNIGACFDFTGSDVVGKLNGGAAGTTATLGTIVVDTAYTFEIEINAAGTAVTFRLRNGLTDAVISEETLAYTLATTFLRWTAYYGIYVVNPGGVTAIDWILDVGDGTRPGYDAWRGSSAP